MAAPASSTVCREAADAARIAVSAGRALVALRQRLEDRGAPPREVRDGGDRHSHDLITAALRQAYPGDPVLSEEGADDPRRLGSSRVWIVDPLDGTAEFGEPGRTDWAVHVALVVEGWPVAAAVALPAVNRLFRTDPPAVVPPGTSLRIAVSRSRAPDCAPGVARRLGANLVRMGSAGYKAMAVVRGEVDAYLHTGGQYEWDSAAPVGVAAAAGLHVSRIDGTRLEYNRPRPWLPDQLICRAELAPQLLEALAEVARSG